jgi:hypothetical protein
MSARNFPKSGGLTQLLSRPPKLVSTSDTGTTNPSHILAIAVSTLESHRSSCPVAAFRSSKYGAAEMLREHDYADQLRALDLAEPFFAPDTLIVVGDTNNEHVRGATLDFMKARPGRYELLLDERTARNSHPTFWNGLMVLGPAEAAG